MVNWHPIVLGWDPQRYALIQVDGAVPCVEFFISGWCAARRQFADHSQLYVISAAENWCNHILNLADFTMEERLSA